jgi:hypothetical protein
MDNVTMGICAMTQARIYDFVTHDGKSLIDALYELWTTGDYHLNMRSINKLLQHSLIKWDGYYMVATISDYGIELLDYVTMP